MVCSSWLHLLLTPEFTKLHSQKSLKSLIINKHDDHKLKLIETHKYPNEHALVFDYSQIDTLGYNRFFLSGSCNGIILLNNIQHDLLLVCNPMLREYITLPQEEDSIQRYPTQVGLGFGYCIVDDQFKVIRFLDEEIDYFEFETINKLAMYYGIS